MTTIVPFRLKATSPAVWRSPIHDNIDEIAKTGAYGRSTNLRHKIIPCQPEEHLDWLAQAH